MNFDKLNTPLNQQLEQNNAITPEAPSSRFLPILPLP